MINLRSLHGVIILALLTSFITMYAGCRQASRTEQNPKEPNQDEFEQMWGVQIKGLRLSAGGYMLDFRYTIVDPNKAAHLMDNTVKPYIADEKTGSKFIVPAPPKVGSLRQKSQEPLAGKTYFIMFANPGKFLKQGDRVTVVIGDFSVQNLIVE